MLSLISMLFFTGSITSDPYKVLGGLIILLLSTIVGLLKYISSIKLKPIEQRLGSLEENAATTVNLTAVNNRLDGLEDDHVAKDRVERLENKDVPTIGSVDRAHKRLDDMEGSIEGLQKQLLKQVLEIADNNHEHRMSQQEALTELKMMLMEKYAGKQDCRDRMQQLRKELTSEIEKQMDKRTKSLDAINRKLDDLL